MSDVTSESPGGGGPCDLAPASRPLSSGEDDAQLNLGMARSFLDRGFTTVAITQLQTVTEIYPGTSAAGEAAALLRQYSRFLRA